MVRLSTLTGLNSQSTIIYGLKNGLETIKCLVSSRRGSSDSGDSGAPNVATKRKTTSVDLKAFFAFLRLCQSVGLGSAIIQRSRFRKVKCKAANLHITKKRNKHLCARPSSFQCQWSMVHVELYTLKKKNTKLTYSRILTVLPLHTFCVSARRVLTSTPCKRECEVLMPLC